MYTPDRVVLHQAIFVNMFVQCYVYLGILDTDNNTFEFILCQHVLLFICSRTQYGHVMM